MKRYIAYLKREVLIGRWRYRRFIFAIPFYFILLGKLTWVKYENNLLRGRIMEMEKSLNKG